MSDNKVGRPVHWTPERIEEAVSFILPEIATSELGLDHVITFLKQTGKDMPDPATFYGWLTDVPELDKRYTRAREQQQHYCIDSGVVLARNLVARVPDYQIDPAAFKAYFDAVKFRAMKLSPKVYGEKQTTEHVGKDGGPIQTESTFKALSVEELRNLAKLGS